MSKRMYGIERENASCRTGFSFSYVRPSSSGACGIGSVLLPIVPPPEAACVSDVKEDPGGVRGDVGLGTRFRIHTVEPVFRKPRHRFVGGWRARLQLSAKGLPSGSAWNQQLRPMTKIVRIGEVGRCQRAGRSSVHVLYSLMKYGGTRTGSSSMKR